MHSHQHPQSTSTVRWLLIGALASALAVRIASFAIVWSILQSTHSPWRTGMAFVCSSIPAILFSLIGGTLADTKYLRASLIGPSWASVAVLGTTAFAWRFVTTASYLWVCAWLLCLGALAATERPALMKMLGTTKGKALVTSIAYVSTGSQVIALFGPAVAGFLLTQLTYDNILWLCAGISALGALLKSMASRTPITGESEAVPIAQSSGPLWKDPMLRQWGVLFAGMNFFLVPVGLFVPLLVVQWYGNATTVLVWFETAVAIGCLIGSIGPRWWTSTASWHKPIQGALGVASAGYILLSCIRHPMVTSGMLFFLSAGCAFISTALSILFQQVVREEMKGRAFGMLTAYAAVLGPLGYYLFGLWVETYSLRSGLLIASIGFTTFVILVRYLTQLFRTSPRSKENPAVHALARGAL